MAACVRSLTVLCAVLRPQHLDERKIPVQLEAAQMLKDALEARAPEKVEAIARVTAAAATAKPRRKPRTEGGAQQRAGVHLRIQPAARGAAAGRLSADACVLLCFAGE